MKDGTLERLIMEETAKRLQEMSQPDYSFPKRITRLDVLAMVGLVAVSLFLIILCVVGVIE